MGSANHHVPRGYPHLGLAAVDSVFSLRARYPTVVRGLDRYCAAIPELSESAHDLTRTERNMAVEPFSTAS